MLTSSPESILPNSLPEIVKSGSRVLSELAILATIRSPLLNLDERSFERIGLGFYRSPYGRQIWEEHMKYFDRKFVPFFEELLNKE